VGGHLQLSLFGADHAPATLLGSCGSSPGLACRLVWNVSHDGRAATLTSEFLAGPVHLLLRVLFVVLLALVIQWLVHRLINRLTERAAQSLLPQFRGGMAGALRAPARGTARRFIPRRPERRRPERRRRSASDDSVADDAAAVKAAVAAGTPTDLAGVSAVDGASQGAVDVVAAHAETGLVDERRKQRVRALGAILRSASSVTIFSIAPLRMCQTIPFTSRTRVIRSVTFSTVPVASPTVITSPTPYWSSTSMKIPAR
jgi:hypothetical protein